MECMNCGKIGHKFRSCPKPIMSYGIACFIKNKQLARPNTRVSPDEWMCIFIQRRHTYSYVDYLRGKYSIHDTKYHKSLIKRMTQQEIENIASKPFDDLWENLWMEKEFPSHSTVSKKYKQNAKHKHEKMKELWFCRDIKSEWNKGAEWGLPKGRRNMSERSLEVAKREFWEETGIQMKDITLLTHKESEMICENYIANNGHHYNNLYAIAVWKQSAGQLNLEEVKQRHSHMYSFKAEISNIQAFSQKEIPIIIRSYEIWKQSCIDRCFSVIHSKEKDGSIT